MEAIVAPSAEAAAAPRGHDAPHSGQNFPGDAISR